MKYYYYCYLIFPHLIFKILFNLFAVYCPQGADEFNNNIVFQTAVLFILKLVKLKQMFSNYRTLTLFLNLFKIGDVNYYVYLSI